YPLIPVLPSRLREQKQMVPEALTDGPKSLQLSIFTGASTCFGTDHISLLRWSAYHRWAFFCALSCGIPSNGRVETKINRFPSGLKAGSQSFHCPENGAVTGLVHLPPVFLEKTMVWPSARYTVLPSGIKVDTDSLLASDTPSCVNTFGCAAGSTISWLKAVRVVQSTAIPGTTHLI